VAAENLKGMHIKDSVYQGQTESEREAERARRRKKKKKGHKNTEALTKMLQTVFHSFISICSP